MKNWNGRHWKERSHHSKNKCSKWDLKHLEALISGKEQEEACSAELPQFYWVIQEGKVLQGLQKRDGSISWRLRAVTSCSGQEKCAAKPHYQPRHMEDFIKRWVNEAPWIEDIKEWITENVSGESDDWESDNEFSEEWQEEKSSSNRSRGRFGGDDRVNNRDRQENN